METTAGDRGLRSVQEHWHLKEDEIEFGTVVWGRVTGYPWWPARVALNEHTDVWKKNGRIWVNFFNDQHGAWLPPKGILPWVDEVKSTCMPQSKKYRERVETAVEQAEEHLRLIESFSMSLPSQNAYLSYGNFMDGRTDDFSNGLELENEENVLDSGDWWLQGAKRKQTSANDESDDELSTSKRLRTDLSESSRHKEGDCPESLKPPQDPPALKAAVEAEEHVENVLEKVENQSRDEDSSQGAIDVRALETLPADPVPEVPEAPDDNNGSGAPLEKNVQSENTAQGHDQNNTVNKSNNTGNEPQASNDAPPTRKASLLNNRVQRSSKESDTETESDNGGKPNHLINGMFNTVAVPTKEWELMKQYVRGMERRLRELEGRLALQSALQPSMEPGAMGRAQGPSVGGLLREYGSPEGAGLRASFEAVRASAECFLQSRPAGEAVGDLRQALDKISEGDSGFLFKSIAASVLFQQNDIRENAGKKRLSRPRPSTSRPRSAPKSTTTVARPTPTVPRRVSESKPTPTNTKKQVEPQEPKLRQAPRSRSQSRGGSSARRRSAPASVAAAIAPVPVPKVRVIPPKAEPVKPEEPRSDDQFLLRRASHGAWRDHPHRGRAAHVLTQEVLELSYQ
eukprot:CAMPEP_0113956884 /NCGR_PEP_ID=MMETSP0011_2-20120614/2355_1 /TAXON_ID=101924 /ORGANISM="Rhodosorus marinus" /LENGTH=626 /DNA_ID=CAMNT_0000967171 /DNA_START=15 /DNA_END=1896 /DNA_ORIENTATION=+ /assembly_acc=CAM_ASM_000156